MRVEERHPDKLIVRTENEEETRRVGALLGKGLQPGDVVALHGNLGAGKTRLIQGIAQGLGIDRPVTSPTFILMNLYHSPDGRVLCHIDTYRLRSPVEEAYEMGLDQQLGEEDICVIEWAERIRPLLPEDHIWVRIDVLGDQERRLTFYGRGPRSRNRLQKLGRTLSNAERAGQNSTNEQVAPGT